MGYNASRNCLDMFYPIEGLTEESGMPIYNATKLDLYLECEMGARRLSLDTLIPLTLIYVLLFVSGIIGNLAVCAVIVRNQTMHTSTNYYLFSMAVSDLTFLLLGLPNELSTIWQAYPWLMGEATCKIRSLVSEMTSYSSVLTIVAFSLERYLAICHPLYAYSMARLGRAIKIIALVWLIAFVSAVPFAVYSRIIYSNIMLPNTNQTVDIAESAFCSVDMPQVGDWPLFQIATFVFFIAPMIILSFLYALMGLRIRQTTTLGRALESGIHGDSRQNAARRNILRMLAAVVVAFFVCWAPFHSQRLLYVYQQHFKFASDKDVEHFRVINQYLLIISGCLYYFAATINPILYNVMSVRYREAFKETLCGEKSKYGYGSSFQRTASERLSIGSRGSTSMAIRARSDSENLPIGLTAAHNVNAFSSHGREALVMELPQLSNSNLKESRRNAQNSAWRSNAVLALLRPNSRMKNCSESPESLKNHQEDRMMGSNEDIVTASAALTLLNQKNMGGNPVPKSIIKTQKSADHNRRRTNEWRALPTAASLNLTAPKKSNGGSLRAGCSPSCLGPSQVIRKLSDNKGCGETGCSMTAQEDSASRGVKDCNKVNFNTTALSESSCSTSLESEVVPLTSSLHHETTL